MVIVLNTGKGVGSPPQPNHPSDDSENRHAETPVQILHTRIPALRQQEHHKGEAVDRNTKRRC